MVDWLDNLPTIDDEALPAVLEADPQAVRLAGIRLAAAKRHARRVRRRTLLEQLRVSNAAAALETLPAFGDSFHCIMSGNFDAFDLVPAILRLSAPAAIAELNCATLGTNTRNTDLLVHLLDSGAVAKCTFICSAYFKSMKDGGQIYAHLADSLAARGMPCAAVRSHAKIILAETTDGGFYVVESSANLRSCRNIEQFVMSHDPGLLYFHRAWMEEVLRAQPAG